MRNEQLYEIDGSEVVVRFGDTTEATVDVIVSSGSAELTMSGGLTQGIRLKAGERVFEELQSHRERALVGRVIDTDAGDLPAKKIFHVITIPSARDRHAILFTYLSTRLEN